MKTINKKQLFLAIAGVTAIGTAGVASAVEQSQTGLGSAMVFPMYTVKTPANIDGASAGGAFNTYLSIVNSTGSTKAVKVRFREGKASKEVLDFNVFLSPYDVWVAGVSPTADGGAQISTGDRTCTLGTIYNNPQAFRVDSYLDDGVEDNSLARLQEGYFEVFEMATYTTGSTIHKSALHSNNVPANCAAITDEIAFNEAQKPGGGITGTATLIQPGSAIAVGTDPLVLQHFSESQIYYYSALPGPDFNQADAFSATPLDNGNVRVSNWDNGVDAVSAVMMHAAIVNEYMMDLATKSATNWVVTFPSKHYYVDEEGSSAPFAGGPLTSVGSCDEVANDDFWVFNREEKKYSWAPGDAFSPRRQGQKFALCWEQNLVLWTNTATPGFARNIFGSGNATSVPKTGFENGWARLGFHAAPGLTTSTSAEVFINGNVDGIGKGLTSGYTFQGLPAIGFAVQTYWPLTNNGYAATFPHRWVQHY